MTAKVADEVQEQALDPSREIIDPHLHLWDIPEIEGGLQEPQRFLVPDAAALISASGHRITHTVFVECHAMHRTDGPEELRSLGETEFALGMAAMAASGRYGPSRIAHRIVANADLTLGDAVAPVLEAHIACAGTRLRGIRMTTSWSRSGLFGWPAEAAARDRLADPQFIEGARVLARMGLSLDVWCLHPQLPQLVALARAVPDLVIVLDHVGTPDLRTGSAHDDAIAEWRGHMRALSALPNVRVKISGLGMDVERPLSAATGTSGSRDLAREWRGAVAFVAEAFGPARCMFASNYPADRSAGAYAAIWNAFKLLSADWSEDERDSLFRATAAQTYGIAITG